MRIQSWILTERRHYPMNRVSAFFVLLVCALSASVQASVPPLMNYQGKLTTSAGQPVPDGSVNVRFSLYSAATGGSLLWAEPATGTRSLQVQGGLFNAILGSSVPLPDSAFAGDTWLQTEVNGSVLVPRVQIVSVGYALRAKVAETVPDDSIGSAQLAADAASLSKVSGNNLSAVSGNVGVGTLTPQAKLHLKFNVGSDNRQAALFEFTGAGGSYVDFVRNSTANSQTVRTFRIWGGNDYDVFPSFSLGMATEHPLAFRTNNTERLRITATGNVGIGTTNPQAMLEVKGDTRLDGSARVVGDLSVGQISFADGSVQTTAATGVPNGFQHFATSGSWQVPAGVTRAILELWGAGGGGANHASGGGGGGGGSYIRTVVTGLTTGQVVAITVGAGGAVGQDGGTTSIAPPGQSAISAPGGKRAQGITGGAGGTPPAGAGLRVSGDSGENGGPDEWGDPYPGSGGATHLNDDVYDWETGQSSGTGGDGGITGDPDYSAIPGYPGYAVVTW